MLKLKQLLKESFERKFGEPLATLDGVMKDYQLGKLYTDKDKPPFKTEKQISESIPKRFTGYFDNVNDNVSRLEKNVKQLIFDLGKENLKKESSEVATMYKKYIMEFKVKMKNFERKYRD